MKATHARLQLERLETALLGAVDNADLTLKTRLGIGNDAAGVVLFGDLRNNADVVISLQDSNDPSEGGWPFSGGHDQLAVFPSKGGSFAIDDNASLKVTLKGLSGDDYLGFSYRGELDGELFLRVDGGIGADFIHSQILLDQRSDGVLDAIADGGDGSDSIYWFFEDDSSGDVTILNAHYFVEP